MNSNLLKNVMLSAVASVLLLSIGVVSAAPSGIAMTRERAEQARALAAANPDAGAKVIEYQQGPVMTSKKGANVYLIWYGDWSANTGTAIVPDFVSSLGGSPWYGINSSYTDAAGKPIKNKVTLAGQVNDAYSQGKKLSNGGVFNVVKAALANGSLPTDPNGVYFVMTSSDVSQSGFCLLYCGWHDSGVVGTTAIKYSFVGDAKRCLKSCAAQTTSPNDNPGVDGMVSVLAHELSETVTDPDTSSGWRFYSTDGNENADECAWKFGTEYQVANGSMANVKLGTRDFLIQQNWVRGTTPEHCGLSR